MPTTPVQGFPYPALSDPANGPVAMQNLALALENKTVVTCTSATRPAHLEGRVIYETDTDLLKVSDGAAWREVAPFGYIAHSDVPSGSIQLIGDRYMPATPARTLPTGRRRRITANVRYRAPVSGAGLLITIYRSPNDKPADAVTDPAAVALNSATSTGVFAYQTTHNVEHAVTVYEDNGPAGTWRYYLRAQAINNNNGILAEGTRLLVEDIGSM